MSLELLAEQRPSVARALYKYKNEIFKPGALTVREKELIAVALSCLLRCEACLEFHADMAMEAGATKEDLRETLDVTMYMTGPSTLMWSSAIENVVQDDSDEG